MKIAILNDTHAGARNSSEIFINYQRDFYMQVFFPYLKSHGIKTIIHLGDYYDHRKYINFKVLDANRRHFLDQLEKNDIKMIIVPGNHDVYYKNTNDLNSLELLFKGYEDHVSIWMQPQTFSSDEGDAQVFMVPWMNAENYSYVMQQIADSDAEICMGHFEFKGFEMYRGAVSKEGDSISPFEKFNAVYSGHYHTKSSYENVTYLGAQMEFTWSDCDDPKYFHILDLATQELTAVRNPLTLFTKIIYNDLEWDYSNFDYKQLDGQFVKIVVARKTDAEMFDKFISNVQLRKVHDLKIVESFEEMLDEVNGEEIEFEETEDLIVQYVDQIETALNREILKSDLIALYHEAQYMENV